MLAQEMADIIVTKPSTDQWGFNDLTNVTTTEALGRLYTPYLHLTGICVLSVNFV